MVIWIGEKRADALGRKDTQGMRVDIRVLWRIRSTGDWHPDSECTSAKIMSGRLVKLNMFLI